MKKTPPLSHRSNIKRRTLFCVLWISLFKVFIAMVSLSSSSLLISHSSRVRNQNLLHAKIDGVAHEFYDSMLSVS